MVSLPLQMFLMAVDWNSLNRTSKLNQALSTTEITRQFLSTELFAIKFSEIFRLSCI